ncbi:MAG: spore protease YyaC [Clostridiales bacterium]|jgi:putative sporulation protein YyaC|nr:spore protease YyaC [Clostridiales bacterium]
MRNAQNDTFSIYDENARLGLRCRLTALLGGARKAPVLVCIGSDRVTGDCLGPLTGHLLTDKYNIGAYVYGTLEFPVTALNLAESRDFILSAHPGRKIVAVDAALGSIGDVGAIRIRRGGIKPGAAVDKDLPEIGDVGITAVVGGTEFPAREQLVAARLNFIWKLAETIAAATADAVGGKFSQSTVNG